MRTRGSAGMVVVVLSLALGCSGYESGGSAIGHSWPPDEPRVELARVIELRRDLGGGRLLGWITGTSRERIFGRPFGVAWLGDDLLVTDPGAGLVLRLDERGRLTRSAASLLRSPIGVAPCLGGVVVSDSVTGRVALLAPTLELEAWLAVDLERPTGLVCRGDRVLVAETGRHRLVELTVGGIERTIGHRGHGAGEFNFPTVLAAEASRIWVGDTLNFRVQVFDADERSWKETFGSLGDSPGETPRMKDMTVDSAGILWVTDAFLDQVALFRADGSFLMSLGRTGAAPGEFSFPAGVAAHPSGSVAVADALNRRVQVFRLLGAGREAEEGG